MSCITGGVPLIGIVTRRSIRVRSAYTLNARSASPRALVGTNTGDLVSTSDPLRGSIFTLSNYTTNNAIPVNGSLMSFNINGGAFIINSITYQVGFNPVFIQTLPPEYGISIGISNTQILSSSPNVSNVYFMLIDNIYEFVCYGLLLPYGHG